MQPTLKIKFDRTKSLHHFRKVRLRRLDLLEKFKDARRTIRHMQSVKKRRRRRRRKKKEKEKTRQRCVIFEGSNNNRFVSSWSLLKKFAPLSGHLVGWM